MDNRFKDDGGRWRTQSLFRETSYGSFKDTQYVLYTLKDYDIEIKGRKIPSLKALYLSLSDPTEYKVATLLFGGLAHWETLCNLKWFKDHVETYRYELEIKLRSEAFEKLRTKALSDDKDSLSAAKFISDGSYKSRGRGRPSKSELAQETKKQSEIQSRLQGDAERIGLGIIQDKQEG